MKKKRILEIAANLTVGGAEKVIRDIGMYADPKEYEHHFVVFGNTVGAYESELLEKGHKVFHIRSPRNNYIVFYQTIRRLIREYNYTVVHAHTMFNAGWVMLAARQSGVPIRIAHAHSALTIKNEPVYVRIYEALMRSLILANATDLVACGVDAGNRLFGKEAFAKRGTLVLNGIDVAAFAYSESKRKEIRQQLGWLDTFLIGHVGHLAEVKNQAFLLEMMPTILEKRPEARLILLGEGEDRQMLEQKIKSLCLSEYVRMTGNVMNVPDYLSAMDVFAFPSLYEGMPLSIMEVQANGLPCVLSEGVPKDVFLTDLLTCLPLDQPDKWINAICNASRSGSEDYQKALVSKGVDLKEAMEKIYKIYDHAVC